MKIMKKIIATALLFACCNAFSQSTIPGVTTFATLPAGNQPLSLLDSSFLAVQNYINGAKTCTPVYSNTAVNNCGSTAGNGINFYNELGAVGATGMTDVISLGNAVPSSASILEANGLGVYVNNSSTITASMGIYSQSRCLVNNSSCWAINAVADVGPGLTSGAAVSLIGMEMDVGSSSPLSAISGAYGYTAAIGGTTGGNGVIGTGFFAGSNTPITTGVYNRQWQFGYQTQDGGVQTGMLIGAGCTGAGSGSCTSQPIDMRAFSSGTLKTATFYSDGNENVIFNLGTSNIVSTGGVQAATQVWGQHLLIAGNATSGQGGQVKLLDDAGTTAWYLGLPGSAGSTDFALYNGANSLVLDVNQSGLFQEVGSGASLQGTITLSGVTTGTNTDFACFSSGNVLTLQSTACTISSKRFKDDLGDPHLSASRVLECLRLAYFRKKDSATNPDRNEMNPQYGLYAEDVEKCDKTLSIYDDDGKTVKSYRQESVIALLIDGWQEQHSQIMALWAAVALLTIGLSAVSIKVFKK